MASFVLGTSVETAEKITISTKMLTRHGIIAGATGTGKTITLQVLAEQFSQLGISVFTADAKGDMAGISQRGSLSEKISERLQTMKLDDFTLQKSPTVFWDLYQEKGHPVRTTVSEMGPLLLSRLLNLSEVQDALLHMAFAIADEQNLLLLDLKDLKALLQWMGTERKTLSLKYGNITDVSIASLQRQILILQKAGADLFFGEKAFDLKNLLQKTPEGHGIVSVLDAQKLMQDNRLYSTFLLWILGELFEDLPEGGDQEMPKLVFFFDEAHLLFTDAPDILIEKIEQVVRLVRSKGVGIFFVTQNPMDIPEKIRGQLGNRVQHSLRAFTPKEQKAIKEVCETFRQDGSVNVEELISSMKVGHALVSFLNEHGEPSIVQHAIIRPPEGRIGTITESERKDIISNSIFAGIYDQTIDRESAFELIEKRRNTYIAENQETQENSGLLQSAWKIISGNNGKNQSFAEMIAQQVLRNVGNRVASQIVRGVLSTFKK